MGLVEALVAKKLLLDSILDEFPSQTFRFQFVNTMTTWISSYSLYDSETPYEKMKPIYLAGIFNVFEPFLSPKGKVQFDEVMRQFKERFENE